MIVGDGVVFDAVTAPIELHPFDGAEIVIGDGCRIGSGASIEATRSVTLGARCRIGEFSKIIDNHHHPVTGDRHLETPEGIPVALEDDVTLDPWAVVLAGAQIGAGARIGAATVIRRRVHARAFVCGHPPRLQGSAPS